MHAAVTPALNNTVSESSRPKALFFLSRLDSGNSVPPLTTGFVSSVDGTGVAR